MNLNMTVLAPLLAWSLGWGSQSVRQASSERDTQPRPQGVTRLDCRRDVRKYPEPREALVIGNSAYTGSGWAKLNEAPRNDAREVARRLCSLGFSVSVAYDLDKKQFRAVLEDFQASGHSDDSRTRIFYYSGHGTERDGRNYLIPTDVSSDHVGLPNEAVLLRDVFKSLDPAPEGRIGIRKIVFLDSCRADKAGFRSGGFAEPVEAPAGSFVSYATAPFATASAMGRDGHSRFTGALLRHIGRPGETLSDMLSRVRDKVYRESRHVQIPWESGSAPSAFKFAPDLQIDPVSVRIPIADDLVVFSVNGQVAARRWREQASSEWMPIDPRLLRPGDNPFSVEVYNDKTHRSHISFYPREGWRYRLELRVKDTSPVCWEHGKDVGEQGKDWGVMFSVLRGVLNVDETEGSVTLSTAEPQPQCF